VGSIGRFTLSASVAAGVLAIGLKRIIAANHKIVSLNGIEELLSIEVNGCTQWISIRGRDRRNPVVLGKTCFWSRNGIGEAPARRSHRTIPQRSRRVGRCANCKLTPYPGPIGTLGVGASAPSVNGWFLRRPWLRANQFRLRRGRSTGGAGAAVWKRRAKGSSRSRTRHTWQCWKSQVNTSTTWCGSFDQPPLFEGSIPVAPKRLAPRRWKRSPGTETPAYLV
jgi:hypothetical protein